MNKLCFLFIYFVLLNACSKESPLQSINPSLPAAKVACDSTSLALQDSIQHAMLDSLQAVIDSLHLVNQERVGSSTKGEFSIDLIFVDEFSEEQQSLIRTAVDRWEEIIVGDIPNVTYDEVVNGELPEPLLGEVFHPAGEIDDLSVLVYGHTRDHSTRSILSKVIEFRDEGVGIPAIAVLSIRLDRWDVLVDGGYMTSLIQHEMGHNLGFMPFKIGSEVHSHPSFTGDFNWKGGYLYEGVKPTEIFFQMLIDSSLFRTYPKVVGVTLEDNPSIRTLYEGHWRSFVFDNELMTGVYRGTHEQRPLSQLTVALMEDIGYEVDYDQADEYAIPRSGVLGKPVVHQSEFELSCGHQF